ncbi:MAG: hypothetical protein WDM76_03705 [Limisphaerales bacterium]
MLAFNVHAQTTTIWNPAGNPTQPSDGLWSSGANWTGGVAPDGTYKAVFNVVGSVACVVNNASTSALFVMGDGGNLPGDSSMIIANGGSMTTSPGFSAIGYNRNASLEVQNGGSMTAYQLWVGLLSPSVGTLTMNGGTVTCNDMFGLGWDSGTGYAHINAGTLNLLVWHDTDSIKGSSVLDVTGGTVIINGNRTTSINNFITNGKITAYGGAGTLNVDFNITSPGKTTISATPPLRRHSAAAKHW